jgi:hypothetical protein
MSFEIEDLKNKYKKRTRIDIFDLEKLQILVPVLIREICRIEDELAEARAVIQKLEKKRPPDVRNGKVGNAEWDVCYDIRTNRLKIKLTGIFDSKAAKMASNAVIGILENVEKNFDVINDTREIEAITDMRTLFHLRKVRYLLVQAGVNRTVRIEPEKESVITAIFRKYFQDGAKIIVVKSDEDAEMALENDGKYLAQ